VAPGHEIIADSGEGFATRVEVDQELERIKHTASAAPVDDLTHLTPGEQPVDHVWGIGPVYRSRLEGIGIATVGRLAAARVDPVAAAMDVTPRRAAAFIAAANRLLGG
jgi:predicted flap endonuclease-1-like 5' DNA nuclease